MARHASAFANILRAGYWPGRVLRGRACGGLGNFAAVHGAICCGGAGDSIRSCSCGSEARRSHRLASIAGNQALSGLALGTVATAASQRASGSAEFRAFRGVRRQIACLATRGGLPIAIRAARRPAAEGRRGVASPFGMAAPRYAGSGHRAGNLEKSASGFAPTTGSTIPTGPKARIVCRRGAGSGVWACIRPDLLLRAKNRRDAERVGVNGRCGAHESLCGDSPRRLGRG